MLVGKIIYLFFASLMALIDIFWFIQKLSQQKILNYTMGFLGLIKCICIAIDICNNSTPGMLQVITEPIFTLIIGLCALYMWRHK